MAEYYSGLNATIAPNHWWIIAPAFSGDQGAEKLLYLVLKQTCNGWKSAPREWLMAKTQFAVIFGERFVSQ